MGADDSHREVCSGCDGVGYLIGRRGEFARAWPCPRCRDSCAVCGGLHFVMAVEGGYDVARPCECTALLERIRLYNEARIPGAYADRTIMRLHDRGSRALSSAKARMIRYYKEGVVSERGVVLLGGPGSGKTHLVVGLLHDLTLQRGLGCRFVDFFELCARIRATFNEQSAHHDETSERDIINDLVQIPVLVIDDLGKGQGSAWELTVIDQLVTRRYNAKKIILATSNYLPEAELEALHERREAELRTRGAPRTSRVRPRIFEPSLEERIGARLVSRLHENCDFHVLSELDDYRLSAAHSGSPPAPELADSAAAPSRPDPVRPHRDSVTQALERQASALDEDGKPTGPALLAQRQIARLSGQLLQSLKTRVGG